MEPDLESDDLVKKRSKFTDDGELRRTLLFDSMAASF
jgi:hypothetical protein